MTVVGVGFRQVAEYTLMLAEKSGLPWSELRGAHIFITGGTGFIGRWLLETLVLADQRYGLALRLCILSRHPDAFSVQYPQLAANCSISYIAGDVRDFSFPPGKFTHILHLAAVAAQATFGGADPLEQFDIAYRGSRRVLEFARHCGARRLLMSSSGSIYGKLPFGLERTPESFTGAPLPDNLKCAPEHGKRAAEFLCAYYREQYGLETVIARCFTFLGPGLPLDIHYAAGNFIRDALWGESVVINGDGSPIRSYLYVADLLVWLLIMLVRAPAGAVYNVGSDRPVSILELATRTRNLLAPDKSLCIRGADRGNANRNIYVPDISKSRVELGLDVWTSLDDAILATAQGVK
jgi:dTDP-glucose 4,6-dehydratase/UDP-glucose 4-epimerase